MSVILESITKTFDDRTGRAAASRRWTECPWRCTRGTGHAAGAVGLRQDHGPSDDRRLRDANRRPDPDRRNDVSTLPPHARNTAMVFQSYAIFPHLTVAQNVAFAWRCAASVRRRSPPASAPCWNWWNWPGCSIGRPSSSPAASSSGGAGSGHRDGARVLLFDEPLSNLDAKLREQMRSEVRRLQRRLTITSVYVTHDQRSHGPLGSHRGDGVGARPASCRTVRDLCHPTNRFVADFIGR